MVNWKLVSTKAFEKAFHKVVALRPDLKAQLEKTLKKLQTNAFDPQLKTHKLKGSLLGCFACSCGYDCRIVFSIEKQKNTMEEVILLVDIGTHDEVY